MWYLASHLLVVNNHAILLHNIFAGRYFMAGNTLSKSVIKCRATDDLNLFVA